MLFVSSDAFDALMAILLELIFYFFHQFEFFSVLV